LEKLKLYGCKVSYFTGKLEVYLRYKGLPYDLISALPEDLLERSGAAQMPALELPDGRWLTDSTPIIAWLEQQHPSYPVMPTNPVMKSLSLLIEDYADEWLWRPAMHYRWSFAADRELLSRKLSDELLQDKWWPGFVKRMAIRHRQHGVFVKGDGITNASAIHAEKSYHDALDCLSALLEKRPFLMGDRPSLVDIALMGPMFRHFSHEPTPAAIMQERAPAVWAWVARMWDAKGENYTDKELLSEPDEAMMTLLEVIGRNHLDYCNQNAAAFATGKRTFDATIEGVVYPAAVVSRYRIWCMEQLRSDFKSLNDADQAQLEKILKQSNCWDGLWQRQEVLSNFDLDGKVPFATGLEVVTEAVT